MAGDLPAAGGPEHCGSQAVVYLLGRSAAPFRSLVTSEHGFIFPSGAWFRSGQCGRARPRQPRPGCSRSRSTGRNTSFAAPSLAVSVALPVGWLPSRRRSSARWPGGPTRRRTRRGVRDKRSCAGAPKTVTPPPVIRIPPQLHETSPPAAASSAPRSEPARATTQCPLSRRCGLSLPWAVAGLASGSWRRRWRWTGSSRRVGRPIALMLRLGRALRRQGSGARRWVCHMLGWAPGAERSCAVVPVGPRQPMSARRMLDISGQWVRIRWRLDVRHG